MKKYLKIWLGSFVFLIMFGAFAGVALAVTTIKISNLGGNQCMVTITVSQYEGGPEKVTYRLGKINSKTGGCDIYHDQSTNPDGTPIKVENSSIFQGGVLNSVFSDNTPKYGNRNNDDVRRIQIVLKNEGFVVKNIDGVFGTQVRVGLKAFQKKFGQLEKWK